MALCNPGRDGRVTNAEEVILGRAVDLLDQRNPAAQPTITDVLAVIAEGPDALRSAARAGTPAAYQARTDDLAFTLASLCTGTLAGTFDGPTSRPADMSAPIVVMD